MPNPRGALAELAPATMGAVVGYDRLRCVQTFALEAVHVLKHNRLFLVLDPMGQIAPPGHCGLGLFFDDTRLLSHYELHLAGGPPSLLSAQVPQTFFAQIDWAISDRAFGGSTWDPKNAVHVRRELALEDERLLERLTLTNYLPEPIDFWMRLDVANDFADIFEVRGWQREARGQFYAPRAEPQRLVFLYRGRDGQLLGSEVRFRRPPTRVESHLGPADEEHRWRERYLGWPETTPRHFAYWQLTLPPGEPQEFEWEVRPLADPEAEAEAQEPVPELRSVLHRLRRIYDGWRAGCSRWRSDVEEFDATLQQAIHDLRALYFTTPEGETVISAGIPWYSTVFGRDSLIVSLQTLSVQPRIAVDTLRYLARHQGTKEDPFTEEQPGKILHELRRGEMARAREIPHLPYYGTVDATPLWLILLHETWRWTGDLALLRELWPHALRALEWIDRYGDVDGDGFVEYAGTSPKGLVHQGWKDSSDGVPWPDGRRPEPPIALVEVQGYVYDAKMRVAQLADVLGEADRAARLRREAERLREAILGRFWLEELGTFALALDGRKRPLPTVTTNAGHLLWSRVPEPAQAARMVQGLMSPAMFSGWGIRTLSAQHRVFNPMSYHNGSVWPHDNSLVVLGMCLYGYAREALPVVAAMHEAAVHMRNHRLPELFCGMQRGEGMRPVLYPVSCSPQAWASGALFLMLQGVLGILPDAPAGVLHLREPTLPWFLRELAIAELQVGGTKVALEFRRHHDRTLANVLAVEGAPLQVRVEFS